MKRKIISTELKIDKIDSNRLITGKCIEEMENKLIKLKNKFLQYPGNEKIEEEIEEVQNKLNNGINLLDNMNHLLFRKEVSLVRLNQKRREEIEKGLANVYEEN